MCWFTGVVVIASALHAEGLGFNPPREALPYFCDMYVKLKPQSIIHWPRKSVRVPWCSGYHVCFTRRRSRDRSPREPFAIFLSPVCKNLHWCAGSPAGAVVIASASHAEGLGFYPRGNLLPSFCDMYVKLKASIYYIDQEKMCWFPGVVVITSALHAEGLGFDPRGNLLPSFCDTCTYPYSACNLEYHKFVSSCT